MLSLVCIGLYVDLKEENDASCETGAVKRWRVHQCQISITSLLIECHLGIYLKFQQKSANKESQAINVRCPETTIFELHGL
jgi:hypothetical protein